MKKLFVSTFTKIHLMKKILNSTVCLACLFITSCKAQNTNLDATAFEKAINTNDSVQILDVRTPGEYASGHIKNCCWQIGTTKKNTTAALYLLTKQNLYMCIALQAAEVPQQQNK